MCTNSSPPSLASHLVDSDDFALKVELFSKQTEIRTLCLRH